MSLYTTAQLRESPLYAQLYEKRRKMSPEKRKTTRNNESERDWRFPVSQEREYSKWIDKELRENVVRAANTYILNNYSQWKNEFNRDSVDHRDGLGDALRGIANSVKKAFSSAARILSIGNSVDDLNASEWDIFVEEAVGVNLSLFDPDAHKFVNEWADLNYEFLSNLPNEYVQRVNQIVSQGVAENTPQSEIARLLSRAGRRFRGMETGDQRRSERIARDQVGKLNSSLSRSRMSQARVDVYRWSTSADERVRGNPTGLYPNTKYSHFIMDRKYKQVRNARKISVDGKSWRNVRGREEPRHAGQAINCRCVEIPTFIRLRTQVDRDIVRDNRAA